MAYGYATKTGDTARQVIDNLKLYGRPLDLTGAAVNFIMRKADERGDVVLDQPAIVQNALKGTVTYRFIVGQTDKPGLYNCEWRVVFPTGRIVTVPDNDSVTLRIVKSVKAGQ